MPSLTPKKIDGHTYYYARYCQRVDGKPKIVRTVYLGRIEDLVATTEAGHQPPQPQQTVVAAFGDVAALWHIAGRLQVLPLLDSTLPAKRHQGLSCGQYMLLAAINRVVAPTSKLHFADWYRQTALTRLLPADPTWLSSQNFWNHMDQITAKHMAAFEKQMNQRLIERLHLDLRALVYDGTNFFTYINTRTPSELPQRGHNKQKRGDLRQVSLGLLVSTDFHIPLLHWVYAGNVADSVQFRSVTEELSAHYKELAQTCQHITLIFDKGNNSEDSFETLAHSPFHFVGSLVPSQHKDLLAVPRRRFQKLTNPQLDSVEVLRTQKKVFGRTHTIVVSCNQNLFDGQMQGLTVNLNKGSRQTPGTAAAAPSLARRETTRQEAHARGGAKPGPLDRLGPAPQVPVKDRGPRSSPRPGTHLLDRPSGAGPALSQATGQDHLVHRQRRLVRRGNRAGLPLPISHRGGLQADEGSAFPPLEPHPSLDRSEDPRPRLLLCAGVAAEFGAAPGSLEEGGETKPPSAARGTGPDPRNAGHLPAPERPAPGPHRHLLNPHGSASAAALFSA